MVSVSPMELLVPGNTFGHLQVDLEIHITQIVMTVHACHGSVNSPSYVGQDYFCETANDAMSHWPTVGFEIDDPFMGWPKLRSSLCL